MLSEFTIWVAARSTLRVSILSEFCSTVSMRQELHVAGECGQWDVSTIYAIAPVLNVIQHFGALQESIS